MIVYIDGENLVHRLLHILISSKRIKGREELTGFDIVGLCHGLLASDAQPEIRYYTTGLKRVRGDQYDDATKERVQTIKKWSAVWTLALHRQGIQVIKAGNLRVRDGVACRNCGNQVPFFEEKGVDVRMAVDITRDAHAGLEQVIMSSDSDLIPAVHAAKSTGSRVKNLAGRHSFNRGLALSCGEWQTYTDDQLVKLYDSTNEHPNGK